MRTRLILPPSPAESVDNNPQIERIVDIPVVPRVGEYVFVDRPPVMRRHPDVVYSAQVRAVAYIQYPSTEWEVQLDCVWSRDWQ